MSKYEIYNKTDIADEHGHVATAESPEHAAMLLRVLNSHEELLEALELYFALHDNSYDGDPMTIEMATFHERGRAAIAKATSPAREAQKV